MGTARVSDLGVDLYKIKLKEGGNFDIDFPSSNGLVTINGNLTVTGETTSVGSSDLVVDDNTITVNNGESGGGVTLQTAGIIVDRGLFSNAEFLYDERLESYLNGVLLATDGAFNFQKADGTPQGIFTSSINSGDGNDLNLLPGQTTGIVNVTQTVDYEKQIFPYTGSNITSVPSNSNRLADPLDDDAIPNVRLLMDYVRDYTSYNFQDRIAAPLPDGDTQIVVKDSDDGFGYSSAEFIIDGSTVGEIKIADAYIHGITFTNDTVGVISLDGNLNLEAAGTGSVSTAFPFEMTKITDPAAPADGIKLYSKAEADGGTGLFFINENSTSDEIISRNKALLYSIIF